MNVLKIRDYFKINNKTNFTTKKKKTTFRTGVSLKKH